MLRGVMDFARLDTSRPLGDVLAEAQAMTGTTEAARDIVKTTPCTARPPSGEEAAIFDVVLGLDGAPMPFKEATALRSRISEAIREEARVNGRSVTHARLSRLLGAVEDDIANAASGAMEGTFDAAAHQRLRAASEAAKARARTFAPVADLTRTPGHAFSSDPMDGSQ